jgi:hypothetical protein
MYSYKAYQALDEDLKTQILSMKGVYLELISSDGKTNKELYALFGFYVEIYFDRETEEPLYLEAFENLAQLDEYLEMIDISELMTAHQRDN